MYDIFDEMERMQREMDRLFSNFHEHRPLLTGPDKGKDKKGSLQKTRAANCDLFETKDSVVAKFELPGTDKKDISLNVTENVIEVSAKRKQEKEVKDEKKGYYSYMSSASSFHRALPLPKKVLPEKTKAIYKDGVLKVTMPKSEPKKLEKKGHKVQIE